MDAETERALEAMEARIMKRFDETDEKIHDTETRMLRAFHGWGQTTDAKLKGLLIFDQRLTIMEDRITDLERKNLERGL